MIIRTEGSGFVSVQWTALAALGLVVLLMTANVVAIQYGLGAVRAAVDEAARRGAALNSTPEECQRLGESILRGRVGLLPGRLGERVDITCRHEGFDLVAQAQGSFDWWLLGSADFDFATESRSVVEPDP